MPLVGQPLIRNSAPDYPSNFVKANSVVQGTNGVIWIGSNTGLLMFDGKRCHRLNDYELDITTMAIGQDSLWAGTSTGHIALFDLKDGILLSYKRVSQYAVNHIHKIGKLLAFSTDGEGIILAEKNDTLRINIYNGLADNVVYQSKWIQAESSIVIATDRGTEILAITDLKTDPVGTTRYSAAAISTSLAYFENNLYIGTYKNGIFQVDNDTLSQVKGTENMKGVSALKPTSNTLLALDETGIWDLGNRYSSIPKILLPANDIADFCNIDEGLILALHTNGNISTVDLRLAAFGEKLNDPITALDEYNGVIYASSPGYLYQIDTGTGYLIKTCQMPNAALATRIIASENQIFIGTFNEGLLAVSAATCAISQYNSYTGLPDNNILDMSLHSDTLWMVSLGGFTSLDTNGNIKNHQPGEVFGAKYIYSVFAGNQGILLGTDGNGLLWYKSGMYSRVGPDTLLQQSTIYSISADDQGNVWFNTKKGEIYQIVGGDFIQNHAERITTAEGKLMLSGSSGNGAVLVGKDYLRIISERGDLPIFESAGFESLSGDYIHNMKLSENGALYFASADRIYRLTEKNIERYQPSATLREIKVNLNKVSLSKTEYKSDENHVTFYFGGVWYQNPEMLTFRYRMNKGEWNVTEATEAVFTNLDYGEYEFELQVGLQGDFYEKSVVVYSFNIEKPVYFQLWFIILGIAVLTGIIATIIHLRLKSINRSRMAKQNLLESRLNALRAQVNPHFLFNSFNTLLHFIENDPGQASEYLQKMSDFYRKMLDNDQRQIISLKEELENFKAYFYLQQKRFGEAIVANVEIEEKYLQTFIPVLTLQLLAENALKHNTATRSKPMEIKIYAENGSLLISNKIAVKKNIEPGTGTGLKNITDRYFALFKAKIVIENDGTQFIVKLPLIKQIDARTPI